MLEDMAYDAFEAARTDDYAGMRAALADILATSTRMIDHAARLWTDRLIVVVGAPGDNDGELAFRVDMIPDASGDGVTFSPDQMRGELMWVARMFLAYANQDVDSWRETWSLVPAGQLFTYVERLLTTMAKTTLAYEEAHAEAGPTEACCAVHGWIAANPVKTGQMLAKAHLN
jgi:hypothetical protein